MPTIFGNWKYRCLTSVENGSEYHWEKDKPTKYGKLRETEEKMNNFIHLNMNATFANAQATVSADFMYRIFLSS